MFEIENGNQNKCDSDLLNFVKCLKYETPVKLKSLSSVLKMLKAQNKYSNCSKCKTFKFAGRQCLNSACTNYLTSVKCFRCGRYFVKIGKHKKCSQNIIMQSNIKKVVSESSSKSYDCDETNIFADLDSNQKKLSFVNM